MSAVQKRKSVSERRACRALNQPRSTQRYTPFHKDDEKKLVKRMIALSRRHPRYGYRRIWAVLRSEGWQINMKRVHRLWKREGLKVPRKQHKRRRLGSSSAGSQLRRAEHINHVWSYDFVMDQTSDGSRLKILVIFDEYSRESLRIVVGRSLKSHDVLDALDQLFELRGYPTYIRSDNGPEFIAGVIVDWLEMKGVDTLFIEPGSPWENAFIESFNSRFRDELLNREEFGSMLEARVLIEDYRREYNECRPHSSLGYQTPMEYVASCVPSGSATLRLQEHSQGLQAKVT